MDDDLFRKISRLRGWLDRLEETAPLKASRVRKKAQIYTAHETECSILEVNAALSNANHPKRKKVLTAYVTYLQDAYHRYQSWI